MAKVFGKARSTITNNVNNVFKEGELDEKSNVEKNNIANYDKSVTIYSLDVVISVGYRVRYYEGVRFRKWATEKN